MKTAEEIAQSYNPNCSPYLHEDDVIGAMEEYANQFKPKWISVHEAQPTDTKWKRVLSGGVAHILPHWFRDGKWHAYNTPGFTENISHWQDFTDLPVHP